MRKRRVLYITKYCLTPHELIENGAILVEKGIILAIGGESAFVREPDLEIVDLTNTYALPGFIDTHIHGAGKVDVNNLSEDSNEFRDMSMTLASHGVTSFLPTIVTGTKDNMIKSTGLLNDICLKKQDGAQPIGIHVEGPFLNVAKRGSQSQADIQHSVDFGFAKEIIKAGRDNIKIVTLAPELPGAIEFIELLKENNIEPSMGHSNADERTVLRAVDAGARRCTHLYNGMPSLYKRKSTLTTIALTDDRISVEMILDGYHLHHSMVDIACRTKPKDKIIGVSDSIKGTGLNEGNFYVSGREVFMNNGILKTNDGVIAGSSLTLEKGWSYLAEHTKMNQTDISACFSINPAKNIGLKDRGELRPSKKADICFFELSTNRVILTIIDGKIVFNNKNKTMCIDRKMIDLSKL